MSYKDITAGQKKAKPVAARFIESKGGTTGLEIGFEFIEPSTDTPERLNWVGWLSANAMENTMATLVNVLGYNGNDEVDEHGVLSDPKALAYDREVILVVEPEEYDGKTYMRVKWVNSLSGSAFQGVEKTVIKSKLDQMGFRAAFLAAKQKTGKPAAIKASEPLDESKVPF